MSFGPKLKFLLDISLQSNGVISYHCPIHNGALKIVVWIKIIIILILKTNYIQLWFLYKNDLHIPWIWRKLSELNTFKLRKRQCHILDRIKVSKVPCIASLHLKFCVQSLLQSVGMQSLPFKIKNAEVSTHWSELLTSTFMFIADLNIKCYGMDFDI